ncbi:MAG TPA: four helix bundle protein [Planctomycetota bacterium]|nr:four helix bundle protein [Planctomycetota bacterium]
MEEMQDFRKLRVWQLSQEVADRVYQITSEFPPAQLHCLTDQLRRATDSVTGNIAEGCGRATKKEMAQFLHIALGSANEVDNGLFRASRVGLIKDPVYLPLREQVFDVRKMLVSLIKRVREGA